MLAGKQLIGGEGRVRTVTGGAKEQQPEQRPPEQRPTEQRSPELRPPDRQHPEHQYTPLPGGFSDDDVHRFRIALGRIARRVDRNTRAEELTRTTFLLLSTIVRRGPVAMGELAVIEGLNPTMLSRLVGKLAARGLVAREPGADDRRVVLVRATESGAALHESLRSQRTEVFAEHLAALGSADAAALHAALPALEALADHIPPVPARPGTPAPPGPGSAPPTPGSPEC